MGIYSGSRSEIGTLTIEHLWLTGAAMLIAAGMGVPLGILLTRHPPWAKPVLGVANILQTIPSLALFGFLLPLALAGGTRGAHRDHGAHRLCAATDSAQYVCRDWGVDVIFSTCRRQLE